MRPIFREADQQAQLDQLGFVVVDFLTSDDVGELIELYDSCANPTKSETYDCTAMTADRDYRMRVSNGIRRIFQPRLETLLTDCRPVSGNFFCKEAENPQSQVHMHQDWSFVDEKQHHCMTVWCALQDVDTTNGALAVVPGSHRLNDRPRGFVSGFPYAELQPLLEESYSRHLCVDAGQAVMFDQRLFHWSLPNGSGTRRLAAAGLAVPNEAQLLYPFVDEARDPGKLEMFEVDDRFLCEFTFGERPLNTDPVAVLERLSEPLTPEVVNETLGGVI